MIILGDGPLTLTSLEQIATGRIKVELDPEARARISTGAEALQSLAVSGRPIYGVNTGFGIFADRRIQPEQSANLSRNLILSHSVGVGPPLAPALVRAAMAIRANTLAQGHSGVRAALVERLLQMLNAGVTPIIPCKGSLGASGDLAPLSHLALVLTQGELEGDDHSGRAWFEGEALSGAEAMRRAGLERLRLGPKEGLALNNGASFSTAQLALSAIEIRRALRISELILAVGAGREGGPKVNATGQKPAGNITGDDAVFERIVVLLSDIQAEGASPTIDSLKNAHMLGAVWDVLEFAEDVLQREMNAATDNPLLFGDEALSGGNFHGQPIGLAADGLKRGLAEAGCLITLRLSKALQSHEAEEDAWPNFPDEAALRLAGRWTAELRRLGFPDSIHSLPTSADQEDQNPNAWNAARRLADAAAVFRMLVALALSASMRRLSPREVGDLSADLQAAVQPIHLVLESIISTEILYEHIDSLAQSILEGGLDWGVEDIGTA